MSILRLGSRQEQFDETKDKYRDKDGDDMRCEGVSLQRNEHR
jgi:hypothetical protein